MKINIVVKIALATFVCFVLSYSIAKFAGLNKEEHYPESVFKNYLPEFKCTPEDPTKNTTSVVKSYEAKEIKEVEVTLISSDVEIEGTDGKATEFKYTGQSALKINDVVDGKTVRFSEIPGGDKAGWKINCGPGWGVGKGFNFNINATTDSAKIMIKIPKSIEKLTIHTVSGDVVLKNLQVKTLELKSVSGDIKASGNFADIDAKSVSGELKIETDNLTPKLLVHTTSGDVHLGFKKELDADLQTSSVSGDTTIKGDKDSSDIETKSFHRVFKKGVGKIVSTTVSGDTRVELK